jgi:hypothetical protein
MKSVYVETTVVSYFTARPSRDVVIAARQEATRELRPILLSEYDGYVSVLVREEAAKGNEDQALLRLQAMKVLPVLDTDERRMRWHRGLSKATAFCRSTRKTPFTSA